MRTTTGSGPTAAPTAGRRTLVALLAALAAVALAALPQTARAAGGYGTISGVVTAADGHPLAKAVVRARVTA